MLTHPISYFYLVSSSSTCVMPPALPLLSLSHLPRWSALPSTLLVPTSDPEPMVPLLNQEQGRTTPTLRIGQIHLRLGAELVDPEQGGEGRGWHGVESREHIIWEGACVTEMRGGYSGGRRAVWRRRSSVRGPGNYAEISLKGKIFEFNETLCFSRFAQLLVWYKSVLNYK